MENAAFDPYAALAPVFATQRPEEAPEVEREREQLYNEARTDLCWYAQLCDPRYEVAVVHHALTEKLMAVASGKIKRLIINTPPRIGKSRIVSVEFPTWFLGNNPDKKVIVASYGQDLSTTHSKEARERIRANEEYHQVFNARIKEEDSKASDWALTQGGRYKAVGVGSSLTGHGAHVLIVDDPFRDFRDAHSKTIREHVWTWFWSTAMTRLEKDAAVVILMTRWHRDDLVGRLLDPERKKQLKEMGVSEEHEWERFTLPALAHKDDPIGREEGAALWPNKFSREDMLMTKASSGSYIWSALYDQSPTVKGGNYIDVEKIEVVDAAPEQLMWCRYWDLAASKKTSANFTCGIAGAFDKSDNTLYLANMIRGQWQWPTARERIRQAGEMEKFPIGVEAVAGFKTAFANLMEVMPPYIPCREFDAETDKLTRALPWISLVSRGRVRFVRGPWNLDATIELEAFPGGTNDDVIDAISGVWRMIEMGLQMPARLPMASARLSAANSDRRNRSLVG